jgi:hypothetical protein
MNIVTRKREFLQSLMPAVPAKVSRLFSFGYDTLVGREIVSARANARTAALPWFTAKSKMWRLLGNERIALVFPKFLLALSMVSGADIVAADFSDFGDGRQVLMFAKQTKKGRAIPLYFEILEYPIKKNSQNIFVTNAIKRFFEAVGCTPMLVFDRGFACPFIIRFLAQNKYKFVIRIKKRKMLADMKTGTILTAEDFKMTDALVHAYDNDLRLVVSDKPTNGNDPWYLITNDIDATRVTIIDRYYHRFEIEEFFRDAKRLLRLEWVRFKTVQSLSIALWFAILTCWLFERIAATLSDAQEQQRNLWQVSRFRYVSETLAHEMLRALEGAAGMTSLATLAL